MVDEFIELMGLDLIHFPKEYTGHGYVTLEKTIEVEINSEDGASIANSKQKEVKLQNKMLSFEEEVALMNIDALKTEITSIHKFENAEKTSKSYALPKDKENVMHDDRFYCIIMLSHYLYELRRKSVVKQNNKQIQWLDYCLY
jgi:hypothetical protein